MLYDRWFKNPENVPLILEKIRKYSDRTGPIRLMEICGTHTMSIARSGIRSILPENIQLLSGPGCPVCVTPANTIDMVLDLSQQSGVLITSYGDLLRVPGSKHGDSLLSRRALGGKVESVYSPMDAVRIAEEHPDTEVIFLGVGFETTAPGTAACIQETATRNVGNFSVLSLLKRTEPAIRSLIEADDFAVDGFLCPGHVAAVTGAGGFRFLPEDYRLPGVVAGFEPADLLYSILALTEMIASGRPDLKNEYTRLVRSGGNPAALALIDQVFEPAPSDWRGLGLIKTAAIPSGKNMKNGTPQKNLPCGLPNRKKSPDAAARRSSGASCGRHSARSLKQPAPPTIRWDPAWYPARERAPQHISTANEYPSRLCHQLLHATKQN